MPEADLHVYTDVKQAVRDVQRSLVDVALLDLQPAQAFVQQGGVKAVRIGRRRWRRWGVSCADRVDCRR